MNTEQFNWTRVNNDVNGNPRYVLHYIELADSPLIEKAGIVNEYAQVVSICNTIGGRKFHNKQYGGGIVFQSYNLHDEERAIIDAFQLHEKFNLPKVELRKLPNYRAIHAKFIGPTDHRGPRVQFYEPQRFLDEKTQRKTIACDNKPSENVNEFMYRVLCANGFNVKSRCVIGQSYVFLCDNWGDDFVKVEDIKEG